MDTRCVVSTFSKRERRVLSRGQCLVQPLVKLALWKRTINAVDNLAVFEHHNSWNRTNTILSGECLLGFGINFYEADIPPSLSAATSSKIGAKPTQGVTPGCPEINNNGLVALDQRQKVICCAFNGLSVQ